MLPLLALTALLLPPRGPQADPALAVVDRAIARMGGETALRGIRAIRLEVMTQWQRTTFGDHPYADLPSYERNSELRDYAAKAWRNTRTSAGPGAGLSFTDLVRDTVAARLAPTAPAAPATWAPLNLAYVEERKELFTFAPERMVLLARDATRRTLLPDTLINGVAHARVRVTLDRWPSTIFFRRSDGLPAMVRFRSDETNDFGLAPWGDQEIEFWYSAWQMIAPGVLLPRQRDVRRVGRPYKRMTLLGAVINPPAPADSFALSDSVTAGYFATQSRAMWRVSLDTLRLLQPHLAAFPPFLGLAGAIRVGGKWLLIETGQAAGAAAIVAAWLKQEAPGVPIGAAVATWPATGNGGVRWIADQRIPLYTSPGAIPFMRTMLGARAAAATIVATARWVRIGSDSVWLEPLPIPDADGALAIYVPTHRWLYLAPGSTPMTKPDLDAMIARLEARGFAVEHLGSSRALMTKR